MSYWCALIVLAVRLQVDGLTVQRPDKGEVQRGVMRRGTLHAGVLTNIDVSVGGRQGDLGRIWEGNRVLEGVRGDKREVFPAE